MAFRTEIQIHYDGKVLQIEGDSVNLSLSGMLVESREKIPVETRCQVHLNLTGTIEPMGVIMTGKVVRHEAAGFGIHFEEMDLESYSTLKEIVRYNTNGDPDKV